MRNSPEQFVALGLLFLIPEKEDEITCYIVTDEITVDLAVSLDNPELYDEITSNIWRDEVEVDLCLSHR